MCKAFLEDGTYKVRVTTPNLNEPLVGLKRACGLLHFSQIEVVQMNNLHADQVDKAVEGCAYIVHTATPVPLILLNKKIDSDMQIRNLVEGTLLLLKAA